MRDDAQSIRVRKVLKTLAVMIPIRLVTSCNCAITVSQYEKPKRAIIRHSKELADHKPPLTCIICLKGKERLPKRIYNYRSKKSKQNRGKKKVSVHVLRSLSACARRSYISCFSIFLLRRLLLLSVLFHQQHVLWMNLLVHRARYEFECKEGNGKKK